MGRACGREGLEGGEDSRIPAPGCLPGCLSAGVSCRLFMRRTDPTNRTPGSAGSGASALLTASSPTVVPFYGTGKIQGTSQSRARGTKSCRPAGSSRGDTSPGPRSPRLLSAKSVPGRLLGRTQAAQSDKRRTDLNRSLVSFLHNSLCNGSGRRACGTRVHASLAPEADSVWAQRVAGRPQTFRGPLPRSCSELLCKDSGTHELPHCCWTVSCLHRENVPQQRLGVLWVMRSGSVTAPWAQGLVAGEYLLRCPPVLGGITRELEIYVVTNAHILGQNRAP